METVRMGTDWYDGVSANGWFVMVGDLAVAGPFCDKRVADRHAKELLHG